MNGLVDFTRRAAYFIWEYTNDDDALRHWYCAEDIACFLESHGILSLERINGILRVGKHDFGYIEFVRHIAFRIYVYTNREDAIANWYAAECLLANQEWCEAISGIASVYRNEKSRSDFVNQLRSDKARNYYSIISQGLKN